MIHLISLVVPAIGNRCCRDDCPCLDVESINNHRARFGSE
ncbi:hypothetical protein KR100_09085 [Synechococcus sp. KORDI-100]|nr:hypothetical protein KR100_09085 [Synechococcus sp. KORDI-100]